MFLRVIRADDSGSRPSGDRSPRALRPPFCERNATRSARSGVTARAVNPSSIEPHGERKPRNRTRKPRSNLTSRARTSSERDQSEAFESHQRRHELRTASCRGGRARVARAAPLGAHAAVGASAARGALRGQQVGRRTRRRRAAAAAHALAARRPLPPGARPRAAAEAAAERGVALKTLNVRLRRAGVSRAVLFDDAGAARSNSGVRYYFVKILVDK